MWEDVCSTAISDTYRAIGTEECENDRGARSDLGTQNSLTDLAVGSFGLCFLAASLFLTELLDLIVDRPEAL